jgi:uncharacterized protein (DUF2062 family)
MRESLRRLWRRLRGGEFSPLRLSLSVAVGLFIGAQPLYGLHFPLCAVVCLPLRLDLVAAYLAAQISNPFMAPLLVFLQVNVGSLVLTGQYAPFDLARARETGVSGFVAQAAIGSIIVGALLAVLGAALAYVVARRAGRRRSQSESNG